MHAVVAAVEARMSAATGLPPEFAEGIHVLRYEQNQLYEPHHDACAHDKAAKGESQPCNDFLKRGGGPDCGDGAGKLDSVVHGTRRYLPIV